MQFVDIKMLLYIKNKYDSNIIIIRSNSDKWIKIILSIKADVLANLLSYMIEYYP